MECFSCGNCSQGQATYYCPFRDEFIIDGSFTLVREKGKGGWKKGDPQYEFRRKKNRKVQKIG